jgi:hypothetical protein
LKYLKNSKKFWVIEMQGARERLYERRSKREQWGQIRQSPKGHCEEFGFSTE